MRIFNNKLLLGIQTVIFILIGFIFAFFYKTLPLYKNLMISFMSLILIYVTSSILLDFIKKVDYGKVLIELRMESESQSTLKSARTVLLIMGLFNLSISKNIYTIFMSVIAISFAIYLTIKLNMKVGINKKGLFVFGEVYDWRSILSYKMRQDENKMEFYVRKGLKRQIELCFIEADKQKLSDFIDANIKNNKA